MKTKQQIIAAILCRLAELRLPPRTAEKHIQMLELRRLLDWARK